MKIAVWTCSATVALLLGLGVSSSQAEDCQDILANNLYRCQVNAEVLGPFESCYQFVSPGTLSPKFDLVIDGTGHFGCTCKAKGKVDDPHFNASKEFFCVEPVNYSLAEALEGKVTGNGKKIKGGFVSNQSGVSGVIECELDPTCTP